MAYTMQQAVNSELAFNPLSSPDGQGEVFVGANQNILKAALVDHQWDDLRFVTKEQIAKAGWRLADGAVPVQITYRNATNAAQWDNKVLFNASQVIGMPPLDAMLGVARARLTPEEGLSDHHADERGHELQMEEQQKREESLPAADEQAPEVTADQEDDLVVGPGKRVLVQEDVVQISPVFRERSVEEQGQKVLDYAVPTLLGTRFIERVSGSGEYVREGEKKTAFLDKGGSLVIRDKQQDTYQAVMELAKSKGWAEIELSGKPESIAKGWLEAQLLGIKVANYVPTEKDLAALDKRRAEMEQLQNGATQIPSVEKECPPAGARLVNSGFFVGTVVDITDGYVVQRDGPAKFVAHKVTDFAEVPKVGELLDVRYKGGRATVMAPRGQSKELGGGREIGGRG